MDNNRDPFENDRQKESVRENERADARESSSENENITDRETGTGKDDRVQSGSGEEKKEEKRRDDKTESDTGGSSSGGSSGGAGAAGGVSAAVAAVVAVVVVMTSGLFGNAAAKLLSTEVFGTAFNYSVSVSFDYTVPEEGTTESIETAAVTGVSPAESTEKADDGMPDIDFSYLDTGCRLLVSSSTYEKLIELSPTNHEITYSYSMKETSKGKYSVEMIFSGTVDGLTPKNRYKLEAFAFDENGGKTSYFTEYVRTVGKISEFRTVSYKCTCSIDGNFNFKIDYTDESGYYTNFRYAFISPDGKRIIEGSIDDPTAIVSVNVDPLVYGKDYTLEISFDTSDPDDTDSGIVQKLFSYDIEI